MRNPQKTMAQGSEDVLHKLYWGEKFIFIPTGDAVRLGSAVICVSGSGKRDGNSQRQAPKLFALNVHLK